MKRALGPEELKHWFLDRLQPFNVVAGVRLSGVLQLHEVQAVLDTFQATQPLCRICIQNENRPRFSAIDGSKIELQVVEINGDRDRINYIEHELGRGFPVSDGPLVRVGMLQERETEKTLSSSKDRHTDLFVTLHHAICDGLGAATMLDDFLKLLSRDEVAKRNPLPGFEELIPPELFSSSEMAKLRDRWWSRRTGEILAAMDWDALKNQMQPVGATRLVATHLDQNVVDQLINRCRSEKTTVHGAITAAAVHGLKGCLSDHSKITHSVSLRRLWDPPFGDSPSLCLSRVVLDSKTTTMEGFWKTACSTKQRLKESIQNGEAFDYALDSARSLEPDAGSLDRDGADLTITNPGRVPFNSSYGSWKVENVYIAGSVVVNAPVISTSTAGTGMTVFFCCPETWQEVDRANSLLQQFVSTLRQAIES